jgi:hypothetical protein
MQNSTIIRSGHIVNDTTGEITPVVVREVEPSEGSPNTGILYFVNVVDVANTTATAPEWHASVPESQQRNTTDSTFQIPPMGERLEKVERLLRRPSNATLKPRTKWEALHEFGTVHLYTKHRNTNV